MKISPAQPHRSRRGFLTAALSSTLALTACGSDDRPAVRGSTLTPLQAGAPAAEPPVANGNDALQRLIEGNARFAANQARHIDEGADRRIAVSSGQHPFATVLGCVDSRVPVELIFDRGLGDLVVVRSAGEALDHSVIGSLEFGVAELGTPLLMVLGHQRCGAVDATIKALDAKKTEDEGDIDFLVDAITPAVQESPASPAIASPTPSTPTSTSSSPSSASPRSSGRWRRQARSSWSVRTTSSTPARW